MKTLKRLLPLLALALLTACVSPGDSSGISVGRTWAVSTLEAEEIPKELRYTAADYSYLTGLHELDYETMSAQDFAQTTADWTDETAFHRSEERLQRLLYSLPEDDGCTPFSTTPSRAPGRSAGSGTTTPVPRPPIPPTTARPCGRNTAMCTAIPFCWPRGKPGIG